MRELKFKVWNGKEMKGPFDLSQNPIYWEGLEDGERLLYTGLKDKDGVEIYEGDMVKCFKESNSVVVNKMQAYGLQTKKIGFTAFYEVYGQCEVIGNVYENKELLGE